MATSAPYVEVVYNARASFLELSPRAMQSYCRLKGVPWNGTSTGDDIPRHDPALVEVVRLLGEAAGTRHCSPQIQTVPRGARYALDTNNDCGWERVVLENEFQWHVAQ